MKNELTRHLKENNLSYVEHFRRAMAYCFFSFVASVVFFIHALFPFLFETTGTDIITTLKKGETNE